MALRLTRWNAASIIALLGLAFLALYVSLATVLDQRMEADLHEDAEEFARFYQQGGLARVKTEIASEMATESAAHVNFQVLSQTGEPLHRSDPQHWQQLQWQADIAARVLAQGEPVLHTTTLPGHDYPSKTLLAPLADDLLIQISESTEEQQELLELLIAVFAVLLLLAMPLALLLGWWMARKAASGIEAVSQAAAQIRRGQLEQRVSVHARDIEIRLLADSFNAMLDRIRDLVTEMREMTDNIAHDLRSPLARIRAISETTLSTPGHSEQQQQAAVSIISECDRLLRMINATLDVAEAGTASSIRTPVDLSRLVADACELFEPVADDKGIQFRYQVAEPCQMLGNESQLQRMLSNIIDNALRYTPAAGDVNVSLQAQAGDFLITISDTGIGIPEADLPRLFDRFFRCDHSRSDDGFGLGLSFARQVARGHGGDVTVRSTLQHGSTFTITLPALA